VGDDGVHAVLHGQHGRLDARQGEAGEHAHAQTLMAEREEGEGSQRRGEEEEKVLV
jgi:hypothetical protein